MSNQAEKKKFNFGQFYGKYGIALIFVVIFIAASLLVPGFFSTYNLKSILLAIACTTVLGFGATFIIIEPLLVATAIYFCLCFPTSKLIAYFERRMSHGDKR